jgi:low affinity Fe/Cu permease
MLIDVLLLILLLMLIGVFPFWPYSRSWGYYPTGGIGLILVIIVVLLLLHVI